MLYFGWCNASLKLNNGRVVIINNGCLREWSAIRSNSAVTLSMVEYLTNCSFDPQNTSHFGWFGGTPFVACTHIWTCLPWSPPPEWNHGQASRLIMKSSAEICVSPMVLSSDHGGHHADSGPSQHEPTALAGASIMISTPLNSPLKWASKWDQPLANPLVHVPTEIQGSSTH